MEVGYVENRSLIVIWGFLQSLKSIIEKDAKCTDLKLSSDFGRLGSLIVTGSWRSIHRYEA